MFLEINAIEILKKNLFNRKETNNKTLKNFQICGLFKNRKNLYNKFNIRHFHTKCRLLQLYCVEKYNALNECITFFHLISANVIGLL